MRRKGKLGKDKTVGYGYVGQWRDGNIGWVMPDHLTGRQTDRPTRRFYIAHGHPLYLCKITVERVKDSRGRYIARKYKP